GQYNSAYADATLFPDVSDSGFNPGHLNTANIRQPQVRYTYLAGNGLSLSASVEYNEGGTVNLPSFNTGVAWDQPWGHLMSRVGVARNEVRNTSGGTAILGPASSNN